MKKISLLFLLFIPTFLFSQAKKTTPKKAPVKQISEIQKVKINAQRWFKDVYVETYFKDPYSYKLLKCDIYPETYKGALESLLRDAESDSSVYDTSRTYSSYKMSLNAYERALSDIERYGFKDSITAKEKKKDVERNLKKYTDAIEAIALSRKELNALTPSKANKVIYYLVYLDCYSNNSYGNPILGKFSFHYGVNGLVRDPIQLNKEYD